MECVAPFTIDTGYIKDVRHGSDGSFDFLNDSNTPSTDMYSVTQSFLASPLTEDWSPVQEMPVRIVSGDEFPQELETSVEPKKAKRQAQNRAAQRAFRERKERYIQELEEKVVDMRKEITSLVKDRRRLESMLKVARAEVNTLKSLPQQFAQTNSERAQVACKVDGGRHSIVLTLDFGIREVTVCDQNNRETGNAMVQA